MTQIPVSDPQATVADPSLGMPDPSAMVASPASPMMPAARAGQTLADAPPMGQGGDMRFAENHALDPNAHDPIALLQRDAAAQAAAPAAEGADQGAAGEAGKILDLAKTQLGVKYVYGAHQWGQALDCSGFTQQVFAHAGIQIGGDTYTQVQQGQAVEGGLANAYPGDLIFVTGDVGMRANGHVGIYLGNGQVIAAPHTGSVVQIQDWSNRTPTAIRRYF